MSCYADDSQLYLSLKTKITIQLLKLQACLRDINVKMSFNFPLLNHFKSIFGNKNLRNSLASATLGGITLAYSSDVVF